jgi:hypothetical protein
VKLGDVLSATALLDAIEVSTQKRGKSILLSVPNPLIWAPMIKHVTAAMIEATTQPSVPAPAARDAAATEPPPEDPYRGLERVPLGPGDDFSFDIVGEASYLARLRRIAGDRLENGETVVVPLLVVPEPTNPHDRDAIKVVAEGFGTVGYFSRDDAQEWRDVAQMLSRRHAVGTCDGWLTGGTKARRNIGVRLSLKEPEDLVAME